MYPMLATVEVSESVKSFDGQGQHGEEPADQQTVGMMMTDMLEAVTTLGVVEALVLDFPTAFGPAEQSLRAHCGAREIRQPVGFHHRTVRLVLAIEEHANGFPRERFPGIEVRRIPELYTVCSMLKNRGWRPARKTMLGGGK